MARKKQNKEKDEKPVKLFTLDTETRGLFGDIFRVGLYDGQNYYVGNSYKEIAPILEKFVGTYECHIYIHNLDFDLSKMSKDLLPKANFDDSIFINNNVAVFSTTDIILHDSLKLLPSSLESLCRDFGMEDESKIDLTDHLLTAGYGVDNKGNKIKHRSQFNKNKSLNNYFMNVDPWEKELNHYLRFDCTSLFKIIMQVVELSGLSLNDFVHCPTTASLAMRVFKTDYNDDYLKITSTNYLGEWGEFVESFIRMGYYGGRTEVFRPLLINGYHYDVNSLYPYVMKAHEYPIGYYEVIDGQKAAWTYKSWKRHRRGAGFAWVKIFVPDMFVPPLPVHEGKKLIFPTGNLTGVWTFHEIEMAERYGCVIDRVEEVVYFAKTAPVFLGFITKFEEIKKTSKGAKRTFAKLLQNSLYGKFGMRRCRDTLINHTEEKEQDLIDKGKKYRKFVHPYLKEEFMLTETISKADYIQPHIAAYVTSYARILLFEGIMSQIEKGEVVSYCDTDSMATSSTLADELVHEHDYGKWKLEAEIEEAIFLQPKLYTEKEKDFIKNEDGTFKLDEKGNKINKVTIKAKGIPREKLAGWNYAKYEEILTEIKNGADRIELYNDHQQRRKFASMLKNGQDFDTPVIMKKGLNLRAKQKRQMDYINNTSVAHKLIKYNRKDVLNNEYSFN